MYFFTLLSQLTPGRTFSFNDEQKGQEEQEKEGEEVGREGIGMKTGDILVLSLLFVLLHLGYFASLP